MRTLALLIATAALLAGCGTNTANTADIPGSAAGVSNASAPSSLRFTAETVAGTDFDASKLAGKPAVFWFWAPWCPTCRAQISGVSELAEQFGDDVAVVGVGALDEEAAIADFASNVGDAVTVVSDPDGAVWRHFEVTSQSTYVVLDADGDEAATGFLDDQALVDVVDDLVG